LGVTPGLGLSRNRLILCVTPELVSTAFSGSVHDLTIWHSEFAGIKPKLHFPVLAHKAYAGAVGENSILPPPVKIQELAYRQNPEDSKRRNANLSRKRVRSEHVFYDLKRFRILQGIFPLRPEKCRLIVKALAAMHRYHILYRKYGRSES
jgi:hypothetical protein